MQAAAVVEEAFKCVRVMELRAFGEKSYFYHKERFDLYRLLILEVESDSDIIEECISDTNSRLGFAEEGVATGVTSSMGES